MREIRAERRRIALHYLHQLQAEFETLLEISRAVAVMAPEVVAVEEMECWKFGLVLAMNCTLLRRRLRLRLRPVSGFTSISSMATGIVRHLESATTRMAAKVLNVAEFTELDLKEREGKQFSPRVSAHHDWSVVASESCTALASNCKGSSMRKLAPRGGLFRTRIVPPCSVTMP